MHAGPNSSNSRNIFPCFTLIYEINVVIFVQNGIKTALTCWINVSVNIRIYNLLSLKLFDDNVYIKYVNFQMAEFHRSERLKWISVETKLSSQTHVPRKLAC